ncbi:MAG: nucleotidyltransferase family protein, partial [Proteobacteria bacterium]|nr:nucleotidyltransferase family protein [Pseudomonadota bacterium]
LAPEDALLAACLHGFKDEWSRLISVADVAGLLTCHPHLDADTVLSHAASVGLRRILLVGVALARDLLEAPCPAVLAKAIDADRRLPTLVAEAIARLHQPDAVQSSVFTLSSIRRRMRERRADRFRYVVRTVLAARVPHYGVIDLPDALLPLYPVVRVMHDFVALPLWRLVRRPA